GSAREIRVVRTRWFARAEQQDHCRRHQYSSYMRTTGTTIARAMATIRQGRPNQARTMIVIAHATAAWPEGNPRLSSENDSRSTTPSTRAEGRPRSTYSLMILAST